jgi:ubiquinone/menaquinone biosynthesis C-methylase UbiE
MKTPPVIDYEGSDYQQKFWEEGDRAYEDAAEELAIGKLLPDSGRHLLELGAGAGRNTKRYSGFERVTLLDYSTTQLQQAIERLGPSSYRYVAADIYRLPFGSNSFDGATMIRTLHHFIHPQTALNQVGRVLTGNAVYLQEFANKRNLKSILRYIFHRQDWNPFTRESIEFVELNFNFHPKSVKEMLNLAGFEVKRQVCVSYLRSNFLKQTLSPELMVALEKALQAIASWTAYSPSIFLRTRKSGKKTPLDESGSFQCPACGYFPIKDTPSELKCGDCGQIYHFENGIYDFRIQDP